MKKVILLFLASWLTAQAATTNLISQFGITFEFDSSVEYGTFANGDYWVVYPVTITNMTPAWDGTYNGWEVNPTFQGFQGFVSSQSGYSDSLRVAMPFTIGTNSSIVKTIGATISGSASKVRTAAVLTVLSNAPPDSGATYFRPPYVGIHKPLYSVNSLQSNLLPTYATVASAPTLASIVTAFSDCLRMDHHNSLPRRFRPDDAMEDYQPSNTQLLNNTMLRLMLNDDYETKKPALIQFTQHTLDRAYAVWLGYRRADDGHNPNHRVLAAWAATMLDITDLKTYLSTATNFHEDRYLYAGVNAVLWGEPSSEFAYWDYIMNSNGGRSNKDPYGLIDGGKLSSVGASYQNITSQSLKGQALVFRLFPQLTNCVPTAQWTNLNTYAERWVTNGVWSTPDAAAPYDGNSANYGITFGPDGAGSYIAGAGRSAAYHGANIDGGQYSSAFVAAMWDAYAAGPQEPTISAIADQSMEKNGDLPVAFTVGDDTDDPGDLTVTRASSNETLLPLANCVLGGSGASRTVTLGPAANETGTSLITLGVADSGGLTNYTTFTVTVNDVPYAAVTGGGGLVRGRR